MSPFAALDPCCRVGVVATYAACCLQTLPGAIGVSASAISDRCADIAKSSLRQSLLRLSDLYQLHDVCDRLEWKVIDVKRRWQNSGAMSRPRRWTI